MLLVGNAGAVNQSENVRLNASLRPGPKHSSGCLSRLFGSSRWVKATTDTWSRSKWLCTCLASDPWCVQVAIVLLSFIWLSVLIFVQIIWKSSGNGGRIGVWRIAWQPLSSCLLTWIYPHLSILPWLFIGLQVCLMSHCFLNSCILIHLILKLLRVIILSSHLLLLKFGNIIVRWEFELRP